MSKKEIEPDEFRLGITMAGAASAGCYTGGVMDYLFEILDLWERAKKGQAVELDKVPDLKKLIPPHRVVIDAMGGCSAGGMTTTMSAIYALNGVINPVKKPGENVKELKQNIFYDSWVLMDDHSEKDGRPIFEKVWDVSDLEKTGVVGSLLNSDFIDIIADQSFNYTGNITEKVNNLPSYISKELEIIFSHSLLRGLPLEVNFETPVAKKGRKSVIPNHTTFEHYIVSHYRLNNGEKPDDSFLWLNPYKPASAAILKLATKATGAFPAGLLFREFKPEHFSYDYIKAALKRVITGELGSDNPDPDDKIKLKYIPEDYSSMTVDGGAINNEPYREVVSLLRCKYGPPPENKIHNYGMIMIDPFPDQAQSTGPYEKPNDLLDVVPAILGTLTDQSRIKRREMLEAEDGKYFRGIIFPRKWLVDEEGEVIDYIRTPIGSASAMAFGGFLDIKFRQHDFFLGRNNARTFFRYFFSFPCKYNPAEFEKREVHPIHQHWTKEMIDLFLITHAGENFLPIIPDLNMLLETPEQRKKMRYNYTIKDMPAYDPENLFRLKDAIANRFKTMMDILQKRDFKAIKEKERNDRFNKLTATNKKRELKLENEKKEGIETAEAWMNKHYKASTISKIGGWLLGPVKKAGIGWGKKIAAKKLAEKTIHSLLKDLGERGLLKKID